MAATLDLNPEYTEEQLNYFRICYIYTDILAEGLRTIFKQEWNSRFQATLIGEWQDDPKNGFDFWNWESPKNRKRHACHLEIMMNGNTSKWDCSMLFYAILYSDCIRKLNPRIRASVDKLRRSRNKYFLGMPESRLSNHEFQQVISTVSSAFQELGLPISQIQGVLDRTVEYTEEQLNYFRICFVVTDLVTEGLRLIFKEEWENRWGTWKDESQSGEMFFSQQDGHSNKKKKREVLTTMIGGDRAKWDCAMLFYAILYSSSFYSLNSAVKLCVEDLRKFRNENVKHVPQGHLSDAEFRIVMDKVLAVFQTLSLPTSQILDIRNQQDTIQLKKRGPEHSDVAETYRKLGTDQNVRLIPLYILARGKAAKAAYQRALKTGKTLDRRVKAYLVGQDRVGKTSVGRSLKGEQFRKDESSTNGVQMDAPLKHVGALPWKNSTDEQKMTAFHHKCAQYLSDHLSTVSSEEKAHAKKKITEKIAGGTELPLSLNDRVEEKYKLQAPHWERTTATKYVATPMPQVTVESAKYRKKRRIPRRKDDIPERVTTLAVENVSKKKPVNDDGIWPVILDFAGQAIYRAIHPLFTSREAIYVLMFDLTKDLSALAQCFVKEPHCNEVEIQAPDCNDTNLDHIMRWMDLVHSYKHVESGKILPPVILVGTHADLLEGDLSAKKKCVEDVKEKICDTTREFSENIGKTFAVNNTLAGKELDEEDPQIVSLREEILKVGDTMPHTKMEVPLKWLQVEDEVFDLASKGTNYITRRDFKKNICNETCQFEKEGDFEVLLNFLHDRGTVVYHGCATDPASLVVLNPKWLVEVLCQIITVEKQNEENTRIRNLRKDLGQQGILHEELLDYSCEKLNLADIKGSLLTIMKKFNLLCEYTCKEGCSIYLVPCMLTSKAEDELVLNTSGNQELAPAYITFNTQYVPGGLFSRLVVLFLEFAERRIACDQPKLCANFARFFIGEFTGIDFVCCKRVIKVYVWDHDNANSNPIEKEPDVCSEVLSFLKISLTRLHEECHWLHAVSWDLCARCNLCRPESGECDWHGKHGCLHDDCAHYVSLTKKPVRCAHTDGPVYRPNKTWIQTLEDVTGHKQPFLQTMCTKLAQMEVAPAKGQSFTAVSEKRASHEDTRSTAHVKEARTVAPEKERFCTVAFKRDALDLGMLSVASAKVARIDSACQEPDEDTQSTIAPEKVAPPGTRLKEHTVINDDLERLSLSIGNNWMSLGRRLNIDQATLDSIQVDARWPNLAEKAFQMLLRWREEKGSDATYWVLCVALCHEFVSRRDLAEKICFRKV